MNSTRVPRPNLFLSVIVYGFNNQLQRWWLLRSIPTGLQWLTFLLLLCHFDRYSLEVASSRSHSFVCLSTGFQAVSYFIVFFNDILVGLSVLCGDMCMINQWLILYVLPAGVWQLNNTLICDVGHAIDAFKIVHSALRHLTETLYLF